MLPAPQHGMYHGWHDLFDLRKLLTDSTPTRTTNQGVQAVSDRLRASQTYSTEREHVGTLRGPFETGIYPRAHPPLLVTGG